MLQGSALTAMLQFFHCLSGSNTAGLQFADLMRLLTDPIYHPRDAGAAASSQSNQQLAVHKQVTWADFDGSSENITVWWDMCPDTFFTSTLKFKDKAYIFWIQVSCLHFSLYTVT